MANDESQYVALPKLFGAPAYARPPVEPVARADRPFDPDEFPLESAQTEEERLLLAQVTARTAADRAQAASVSAAEAARRHSIRLPSITGLLRGGGGAGSAGGVTAADGATATIGGNPPAADLEPDAVPMPAPVAAPVTASVGAPVAALQITEDAGEPVEYGDQAG